MSATNEPMRTHWRDQLDYWTSPVLANMLWVLGSILVLTMPLALVGLLATMYHWTKYRRTDVFAIFLKTIRETWRKAYFLALVDVVIGGVIVLNLLLFLQMDTTALLPRLSLGATLLTIFVFVMANVPAWTLVAVWDAPFKQIIRTAVQLVFINPFWAIVTGVCFVLPLLFALVLPVAFFITLTGALAGAVAARGTDHLLDTSLPDNPITLNDV